ncbi:unnamed protein product [Boreogadus saida]
MSAVAALESEVGNPNATMFGCMIEFRSVHHVSERTNERSVSQRVVGLGGVMSPRVVFSSPRSAAVGHHLVARLPKFSGATPLEPYLAQLRIAARYYGWGVEESAAQLALALEGTALQVLLDLAPADQRDLQALTLALERRFGQRRVVTSLLRLGRN